MQPGGKGSESCTFWIENSASNGSHTFEKCFFVVVVVVVPVPALIFSLHVRPKQCGLAGLLIE